jgi:hypothetical protein
MSIDTRRESVQQDEAERIGIAGVGKMKIQGKHYDMIRDMGAEYLAKYGYTFADVKVASDGWAVLHASGAYRAIGDDFPGGYPDYNDSHFRTVLKSLMPAAFA